MIRSIYYLECIIVHIFAITNNYVLVPTNMTRTENINDINDNMGAVKPLENTPQVRMFDLIMVKVTLIHINP